MYKTLINKGFELTVEGNNLTRVELIQIETDAAIHKNEEVFCADQFAFELTFNCSAS